jgi:hypothetical protein
MVNIVADKMKNKSWRKISKDKYIVAGVITFLIFSLGLTLGLIMENQRYNLIEDINQEQEVRYMSLQLQYLYLNSFNNQNSCPTLATTLKATVKDLSESLDEVIAFEEEKKSTDAQKEAIMRRYILDNLRYWLLAKEGKQKCDLDIVPILYFYAKECPSCSNQGTVLSFFKNQFGEQVLVFPINLDLREQEPMVEIMMSQFQVSKYPTLIVDNKKFEGVVQKTQLKEVICASLKESEFCD